MELLSTDIAGCYRIRLEPLRDARGTFTSVFDLARLRAVDPSFAVDRINRSLTRRKGTIRGIHFQRPPYAEDKLVQCLRGAIFDVCVDLRPESPTYLRSVGTRLSAENEELMLIPKGCGHAFQTLEDDCLIEYLLTGRYMPSHEGGLRWDDPALAIPWPLPCEMTSEKDASWPRLVPARS